MSPSLSRNAATLCGLMAIVLWSTIVGLIRGVSEHFGAVGGAALIYTVGAILLALLLGRPASRVPTCCSAACCSLPMSGAWRCRWALPTTACRPSS